MATKIVFLNHLFSYFFQFQLQKLPSKPPQKIVINKRVKGGLPFDVTALSDGDLARQLKSFGAPAGPITDSTRPLYQKKLGKEVYVFHLWSMANYDFGIYCSELLLRELKSRA